MRILILLLFSFSAFAQLPTTGSLSLKGTAGAGRSISQQVDGNETGNKSLTTLSNTVGFTAPHSMLEFRGYPSVPVPDALTYCSAPLSSNARGGISMSWQYSGSGGNPSGVKIEVSVNGGGFSFLTNIAYPNQFYEHARTSLTVGNTYSYRLTPYNATGDGPVCGPTPAVTFPAVPGTPTNVVLSGVSPNGITASWTAASGSVTGYSHNLYKTSDDSYVYGFATLSPSNTALYEHSRLVAGTSYYLTISAYNSNDYGSPATSANFIYGSPPTAPTTVTATYSGGNNMISWSGATGTITTYKVQRSVNGGAFAHYVFATFSPTVDGSPSVGSTYTYQVRAENSVGVSAYTNSNTVVLIAPGSPSSISTQLAAGGSNGIEVGWTPPSTGGEVTNYRVEMSDDGGPFGFYASNGTSLSLTVPHNQLSSGITYQFRVRAENSFGQSLYITGSSIEYP